MSVKNGVDFFKSVADFCVKKGGFEKVTKAFRFTGGGDGRCIGEFTVSPEHVNIYGTLHGGCAASIIDNVTTYAIMSTNSLPGVSVDLHVSYLKSAKEGEVLIVDANTVKVGKNMAFADCVIKRKSDGTIVVKGGQTKYIG